MWKGKKILLGVTGSIAAYKAILLLRLLVKQGAQVRVVMTPSARDFVTPLTLSTLSNHPVQVELSEDGSWANHVALGRWADLFLIAPLSCHTLSKMASGLCDNLLVAAYLSANCPVFVAPAMDEDMWKHPSTRANLEKIQGFGNQVIPVESGELASGLFGEGRMAEPEQILRFLEEHFFFKEDLLGKKALVTAGPTYEAIDPVRYIGNHSSGKMGLALARELARRGAEVRLILGPSSQQVTDPGIRVERVVSAQQMLEASQQYFPSCDLAIMAAAVADYTPAQVATQKIKKKEGALVLELVKTADILATLGKAKRPGQVLVGFALESGDGQSYAQGKLKEKGADLIVLNSLQDEGAGFGYDTNRVTLFWHESAPQRFERKLKQQVARDIIDSIVNRFYA